MLFACNNVKQEAAQYGSRIAGGIKMKQNITLSLDKDLIKKSKIIAAQRETSISQMLSDELAGIIRRTEQYELAKRKALANLKKGFRFGGRILSSRESLHER
jgi:hypothetical protein